MLQLSHHESNGPAQGMPSIDKQSVREEFDKIKASFQEQVNSGKVSAETASLVNTLMTLFSLLMAIFMEKNTKKTSKNSGIPPSQSDEDNSSPNQSKKTKNRQTVTQASNSRTVETVNLLPVDSCAQCGEDLSDIQCNCIERRTVIDIIFEKNIEHFDSEIKECPSCDATVSADFPDNVAGPLQYGNGIKAYVVNLMVAQMISVGRAAKLLSAMIGKILSEATLLSYIMKLHLLLEPWELQTKAQLLNSACINTDETSFRVNKKNHWLHVYSSGEITLKCLHKKRGKEAMEDIGIIPKYGGVIVHDCWASYLSYDHCRHGLCGSHLLRELTFVIDSNKYRWAKNMKSLLQEACRAVNESKKSRLSESELKRLQRRYRNILTRAEAEMPPVPEKPNGKKGKVAKSDAHNLCERLREHENAVLLFAKNADVPFTNNRAERDLRMSKVKQKVSGCFRVEKYAHAYCRISSYLQTMANKGINPLTALSMAFSGKI